VIKEALLDLQKSFVQLAQEQASETNQKCAQIVLAASGLNLLRNKLGLNKTAGRHDSATFKGGLMSVPAHADLYMHTADVLAKCAMHFDQEEQREQEKRAESLKTEILEPLARSGTQVKASMAEKLAGADPEILALLRSISTTKVAEESFSLGGGATEKVASEVDDSLLAFCLSED